MSCTENQVHRVSYQMSLRTLRTVPEPVDCVKFNAVKQHTTLLIAAGATAYYSGT